MGEGRGRRVVEYEPDTKLRDVEQIRLLEEGGIEGFLERQVLPWAPDAWYVAGHREGRIRDQLQPVTSHKPTPMRTLDEIRADIEAVEREAEGLLGGLMGRELRPAHRKLRVYADTSVIGGCVGRRVPEPSRRLIERCARGDLTLVVSAVTARDAPRALREPSAKCVRPSTPVTPSRGSK